MQNYAEQKNTVKVWMYKHNNDIGQGRGEPLQEKCENEPFWYFLEVVQEWAKMTAGWMYHRSFDMVCVPY